MSQFIGRDEELALLEGLCQKRLSSLAVVYGRRRIGKSRLVEEFAKNKLFFSFAGLAPTNNTTRQSQLDAFSQQMRRLFSAEIPPFSDWGDAFDTLASYLKQIKKQVVVLFDEIAWMGYCDSDFLGKLKHAWDTQFRQLDHLILVLCGSVSSWINKNIILHTGFHGRISLKLKLNDLPLRECALFWKNSSSIMNSFDKLKLLSVIGGVPKYLEEINTKLSAEENIKRLCFTESGLLFNDFEYIFSTLLEKNSQYYAEIIIMLKERQLEQRDIYKNLKLDSSGGFISAYLDELVVSGFIERDYTWNISTMRSSKLSKYRLSDNYLRFYLKYIEPNNSRIKSRQFAEHSLHALPGWTTIMGLQIENLVLNNRNEINKKIGIYPDEIINTGAFFQRKTARQAGCQIDYMVQTKFGDLYVCEVKVTRRIIKSDVITEVKNKIKRLSLPRYISVKPVLIYVGDLHDEVIDADYFIKLIDLASLFDG